VTVLATTRADVNGVGRRRQGSKLVLSGRALADLPGAEVIEGLGTVAQP
jgi:hypothetical protein